MTENSCPGETVDEWFCQVCDYEGTEVQVQGHIGAKHIRQLKPIKHGTPQGYKAEKRRGLVTCPACRRAWTLYYRALRASAKRRKAQLREELGL